MRKTKKVKVLQSVAVVIVVVILLCGIFAIVGRLKATSSTDRLSGDRGDNKASDAQEADNSVPITSLSVGAPQGTIRVGETMQLDISYEPADATNPALEWSCSEDGMAAVSEDGVLTPSADSAKKTVTMTARTCDGSNISTSFALRIYPEIDPSKPMVAITFDDGPYSDTTSPMLDALEKNYAKATFFCLGQNVEYYPEMVQREYELGMEVATHTYSHKELTTLSDSQLKKEIKKAIKASKKVTGVKPSLMRPPYGAVNQTVLASARKHKLTCINWSLDTEDWKTKNADDTYRMVMKATDGDIVLLHDIHDYNVEAVERFVPDLLERGYQLVTVSELYKNRGEALEPGTIHFRTDPTTVEKDETTASSEIRKGETGTERE